MSADLFGTAFTKEFAAFRLCLSRDSTYARRAVYLFRDFFRISVTIADHNGRALNLNEVRLLSENKQFEESGFSELPRDGFADNPGHGCITANPAANAFYTPPANEQLLAHRIYFHVGGFEISRARRVRSDVQRNNITTFILGPLEKIFPGQQIERVVALPIKATIAKENFLIRPCMSFLQADVLLKAI